MPDVAAPVAPAPTGAASAASIMPGSADAGTPPAQAGSDMEAAFSKLDAGGKDLGQSTSEPGRGVRPKPTRAADQRPAAAAAAPAKPPEKPAEAAKPAEAPKPVEAAKPSEVAKPTEVKPGEKPADAKPPTGWQKFHELQKQYKELQSKYEAKEKASTLSEDHPELVRMRSEIAAREKRLAEVETHLKFKDYEASTEYQEQYHRPYITTAETATQRAVQLKITDENGVARNLTPQEFWGIVHIDDTDAAITAAEKLFGEGSAKVNFVIERRNEILQAHQRAEMAKADFRKNAVERTAKEQAEFQRLGMERSTQFKRLINEGIEKDPTLYKPEEGDIEGNALLENGYKRVDQVFRGGAPDGDGAHPLSPQEMISAHAEIRNNAAAFPRLAHKYKAALARMKEMEQELAEYQGSGPDKGEVQGAAQQVEQGTWGAADSALDRLAE